MTVFSDNLFSSCHEADSRKGFLLLRGECALLPESSVQSARKPRELAGWGIQGSKVRISERDPNKL